MEWPSQSPEILLNHIVNLWMELSFELLYDSLKTSKVLEINLCASPPSIKLCFSLNTYFCIFVIFSFFDKINLP